MNLAYGFTTQLLEVRCCCDPSLVVGHLYTKVPRDHRRKPILGFRREFFMGPPHQTTRLEDLNISVSFPESILLELGEINDSEGFRTLAWKKADSVSIEMLRRIEGFTDQYLPYPQKF